LGLKTVWLELPDRDRRRLRKIRRLISRAARLIVFTAQDAAKLAGEGFDQEQIFNISLGVNPQSVERQDNLFSSLAKADKPYSFYKNFTVGAIAGPKDRKRLEILLQAVKGCVNLIPNFRLVVIGQDTSSGNLNWLIKNLGLERRVWLVGEQNNLIQWFADLDLFVVLAENPGLGDLEKALMAASHGVPLLGFQHPNLADIIIERVNGTMSSSGTAEELAQRIIAIEADDIARKKMGETGRRLVDQNFDRQKQLARLREIIS
jgi:glycosyltransferase involved in cell wall biosynthesis